MIYTLNDIHFFMHVVYTLHTSWWLQEGSFIFLDHENFNQMHQASQFSFLSRSSETNENFERNNLQVFNAENGLNMRQV